MILRGERSFTTVLEALRLLGDVGFSKERPALVKVNLISRKSWETGAVSDPVVVEALIRYLKGRSREVYVVESDATMTDAVKAATASGVLEVCDRLGAPFVNLRSLKDRRRVPVPDHEAISHVTVPEFVLSSDVVSAAKMKTHSETTVTLSLKNMFGLLPEKFKGRYHLYGIGKVIVDVNTVLRPRLSVVDGFIAMEGRGPVHGRPIRMDVIVAGGNPVSTDAVASRIMGFNPHEIYHIRRLAERGFGEIDDIEVLGTPLEIVRTRFATS